jgi:plasmid segregation protein ParM
MMTEVLAVDIGFGWSKALTLHGQALIPSLVGPAEAIRYESDVIPANGHGIAVEVDGRWYFVGEQAELQSASRSQTLDGSRTGSAEHKALFYALASELLATTAGEVAVVSGLPVADYDEKGKATLRDMLKGAHVVKRQGKRERRFEVTGVHTMPQAMGSLFALVLDRRGQLADGDLAGARVGIVDVGTLTTNYILVDRLRYVKREYGFDWTLQLGKVDQAVRVRTVEPYGDPVNISHLVEPHLEALADTIISHARSLWSTGVELKAVVLAGGGSVELAPYMRKVYPHTRTVGGDPQFANVTGYLRAGLRKFGG